jgi:ubiquinone biosynthesis accessory factor UbiJ
MEGIFRPAPYNPCMFHALNELLAPVAMDRITLVMNHVLGREPAALDRLKPHAGRTLLVLPERWPSLLPPLPPLAFRITPAGMLEWCGMTGVDEPDLTMRLDASNPALLMVSAMAGDTPPVRIDGPADLAGDVNWLLVNLRWDVTDDLERLFGPAPARTLRELGSWLGRGLKTALQGAQSLADRVRPPR